ncbi:putative GTPase activating protein for Arf-domain-containing protein [Gloeopeniophorella convolvens]|nr:putative GTPase activating protein for Arf-domain-containing protein [Gloeopeniophorella convolvens]
MSAAVSKVAAERNQKTLMELAAKPGNELCADCKSRHPRWASHNLGIFICVNCASIHRKIGTHITKVKSLTMDVWSKEQVEMMRQTGNIKSNQLYNPDEVRNPPPTNMVDAERDSELEKFIRDKYEYKRFINRAERSAIVAAHLGPSRSVASVKSSASSSSFASNPSRSQTLPPNKQSLAPATSSPVVPTRAPTMPPSAPPVATAPTRSISQPLPPSSRPQPPQPPPGSVWSDLAALQGLAQTSTLPLQYMATTPSPSVSFPNNGLASTSYPGASMNPAMGGSSLGTAFASGMSPSMGSAGLSSGLGTGAFAGAGGLGAIGASGPSPFQPQMQQSMQPSYMTGQGTINPFTQLAAQQQSQVPQFNQFLSTSPFSSSLPQQSSPFNPQAQAPQVQQPTFTQPAANPFYNSAARTQGMLSPPPQAPFLSTTPSPVPFNTAGTPFQQPSQSPFQQPSQMQFQQSTQSPYQQHPFGANMQPAGAATGNPFTSWMTQPSGYAAGQGGGQWGAM